MRLETTRLTHENAMEVKRQMKAAIATGDALWDLGNLERLDSCAVALVLEWQRMAVDSHLVPILRGVPEKLRSLFAVYGLENLLQKP